MINDVEERHCDIESHHTHLLLFDDGQLNDDPSVVFSRRAQIEKSFRSYSNEERIVPLILILIEGDISSIKMICEALQENTPVLVVKVY